MEMKCKRILSTILSLMVFTMLFPTGVNASTKSVIVSYSRVGGEKNYPMVVTVEGEGSLIDGEKEITGGSVEYNLTPGTKKYFVIKPKDGYKLAGLTYIRPDINPNESIDIFGRVDENRRFWIEVETTKIELTARFEKIDDGTGGTDGSGSSGETGGGSSDGGNSGDSGSSGGSGTSGGTGSTSGTSSTGTTGTGSGSTGQTGTSSATGTKTGDASVAEWYLLLMVSAAAAITIVAEKKTKVYKESE